MAAYANEEYVQTICKVFHVFSDETRVKLVLALHEGEQHVSELCKKLQLPQPTVSHHLGLLRMHGLVNGRRQGKQVFYSIDDEQYTKALAAIKTVLV